MRGATICANHATSVNITEDKHKFVPPARTNTNLSPLRVLGSLLDAFLSACHKGIEMLRVWPAAAECLLTLTVTHHLHLRCTPLQRSLAPLLPLQAGRGLWFAVAGWPYNRPTSDGRLPPTDLPACRLQACPPAASGSYPLKRLAPAAPLKAQPAGLQPRHPRTLKRALAEKEP